MEEEHRQILARMQVNFVKGLQNIDDIIDYLIADGIFTEYQAQTIHAAGPTMADKTRVFLKHLVRCGPNAYESFVSALNNTNQTFLVDQMSSIETTASSRSAPGLTSPQRTALKLSTPMRTISPYPVTSIPRGYILLINVENFATVCGLSARTGSLEDVKALRELFTDLGYFVETLLDPDSETLDSSLKAFVKSPRHNSVDAGGLIVMSHGLQDYIYAADGKQHSINGILMLFTNKAFPALAGKPKFILFQACRGDEKDRGSIYMPDAPCTRAVEEIDGGVGPLKDASWACLPYMSDCVIAYSTLPGFVSWRCEKKGSWFIQILVSVFREHAANLHVLDLLTEVNRRLVEDSQEREHKQVTQPANTLTQAFYLSTAHFS